ncbi:tetratricopeptide repeat protein [Pontibacter locisalis]|uniref:Tetratricopeptide repeat protein n=1 Tax=Pontibacter locisalis TaxID=1719035 RepID=A0ABW5IGT3_9BACT
MLKNLQAIRCVRLLLLVALCIPAKLLGQANPDLDAAWKSFYTNNRQEARTLFQKASKESSSKAEAQFGLSLLATVDKTHEEAFAAYVQFAEAHPNHQPYTVALWSTPSIMGGSGKKSSAQLKFLKGLIAEQKTDGTLRALAHSSLGDHYDLSNQLKEAEKEFSQIGALVDWQIVGEFENISASGFNKDYSPIHQADSKTAFRNKSGAAVYWFDLPAYRTNRWIDFNYHFFTHNSVIYAQTFVNSPSEQEVQLRVGVSGSLKAWINDALVMSEQEERNNDLDTYLAKVKLKKGYNRVLIQIAESYAGRSNFMARLTDGTGKPLSGLSFSKSAQSYSKEMSYQAVALPMFAEEYFEQLVKKEPTKVLNHLLLGQIYLRNEKKYEARKAFLAAQKLAPESSYIMTQLIDLYQRENNRTQLATALEWLKDNDPENPLSLNLLFNEEVKKENSQTATAILKQIESMNADKEDIYLKRLQLAYLDKKEKEIISIAEQAYAAYPENADFVKLKYLVEKSVKKNTSSSVNVLKSFLKNNNHFTSAELLAEDYFEKGKVSDGLKIYLSAIQNEPVSVGYQYKVGNIYASLQDYKKAEEAYHKALRLSPYDGDYYAQLAKTQQAMGKKEEAVSSYKKAISFNSTDFGSIKELRKLEDKKDVFDYFPAQDVYALYKAAPGSDAYPEDKALILHDEVQRVVYEGGASEEKRIYLMKILNARGIDDWKEYNIPYSNDQRLVIEKAEVIKANGTKVPAETNQNQVVFTNLEVGDGLHVTYRLQNFHQGRLASHFWDKYYFTHGMPYLTTRYSLLVSPKVKFQYKVNQQPIEPKVTKPDADFDLYVWEKEKVSALKYEDKMPVLADIGQTLYLSSLPDWNYVANWYSDLASAKAKGDYEVKEVVAELFKDKAGLSPEEKVKAIYDYIITNITYSSVSFRQSGLVPQKASVVLNTRMGDCKDVSTLFVAMCNEVGIKANLVLVNTRDNGLNDMELPSIEFNHCIARVDLAGKTHYLELTSNFLPFGSLYSDMLNSRILEISETSNPSLQLGYLNPQVRKANNISRDTKIKVEGKSLVISEENTNTASIAAYLKSRYRHLSSKEREKEILDGIKTIYPNVAMSKLVFTGLDGTEDTVTSSIEYTIDNVITEVGGMSLFALPWSSKASASDYVLNTDERSFPIDLSQNVYTDKDREVITIVLPANKKLVEVPKTVTYSCEYADYTLSCKLNGQTLQFVRELKYKQDVIPAKGVKAFGDFYKKVIEADSKQIALK